MFRKCAAPPVGEIKDRHVKDEHGVVPWCASSKGFARHPPEIVFTRFGFHCDLVFLQRYRSLRAVTTLQWRDFAMPLSREKQK
jgi:hypothetical protein